MNSAHITSPLSQHISISSRLGTAPSLYIHASLPFYHLMPPHYRTYYVFRRFRSRQHGHRPYVTHSRSLTRDNVNVKSKNLMLSTERQLLRSSKAPTVDL